MTAVISTNYDLKYLYFLPICVWAWNKLGVKVVCFVPYSDYMGSEAINQIPAQIMRDSLVKYKLDCELYYFKAPAHKQATYAQCSRLYGACLDLPEDEVLITGDVDMAVFEGMKWLLNPNFNDKQFDNIVNDVMCIWGVDLVPKNQFPMCYARATVKIWRDKMNISGRNYQECLDDLLGGIEAEHFRGNYWGKDQETLFASGYNIAVLEIGRAKEGTQFATKRYDRDDSFILDRLSPDTIDFHMNRPGYEPKNFEIILKIFQYHYPKEDFTWLVNYTNEYRNLI